VIRRLRRTGQAALDRLRREDSGSAIVEFTFLAVLVMLPLVYLVVAVAVVQRRSSAVGDAARAAGRAIGQADSLAEGGRRAEAAVRIVFEDQGLSPDGAQIRVVAASTDCSGEPIAPSLAPGAEFAVCVISRAEIPGVPTIFAGRGVETVGRYVVHVDDFRR
jgi:Flp pilus assembly protein TadG